jgi:ferredoxin
MHTPPAPPSLQTKKTGREMSMKISIERDTCVSCGTCWDTCPELFSQNDNDSFAQIVEKYQSDGNISEGTPATDMEACAREAVDLCPVQIIHIEE